MSAAALPASVDVSRVRERFDTLSRVGRRAAHTLIFRTESLSFFPSMIAPLAPA